MKQNSLSKTAKVIFIVVGVLFAVFFSVRTYNSYRFHLEKQTRVMMDTYVTVYAVGPEKLTSKAVNAALQRMEEVDEKFDFLNPKSPLYAFNNEGAPISDSEIVDLVKLALGVSRDSDGAFDITICPLISLWGFYGDHPSVPDHESIERCIEKIGYKHLVVRNSKVEKTRPDIRIDLGGIAKGYAVGEAIKVLRAEGVTSALIDAGGDVYAMGKKGLRSWKVGIKDPRGDGLLGFIEAEDLSIMGSGDYERFFMDQGKRYHHIFNPKTGYPASGLTGTTILYGDPALADAWNTALFVLGPEKGLEIVESIPGMEVIMVTESGEVLYSSGLKDRLQAISTIE
ncbi:MAG: FAD:protein FMN transferase [Deltaproteobacteria bacterium]|nr:FAD:protein FMN transferase [Deltaproteobacteria bacterium]